MVSKNLDAEMLIFFSDDPDKILNDCIFRNNVKHIVFNDKKSINYEEQLYVKSMEIEIHICKC